MAQVSYKSIKKCYGKVSIINNFNLEIDDGEFVVLVGPSGCGKSTILRMLAGLEEITAGDISIAGNRVNDLAPHKRNIAMVFQNYALYPHKTVQENIIFGLKKTKVSQQRIKERLQQVVEMLHLQPYLHRKPADLSGGQRQRVAMGRALARDADVFLFDEPLSNLDAKLRHHMRTEIARIHQQYPTTSIYVTHDQIEAMTLGDRVAVMRDGSIEQVGTPMEIFLNPVNTFVATFIGSASMNVIEGLVENNQVILANHRLPLRSLLDSELASSLNGRKILVGVRPEYFDDANLIQIGDNHLLLRNIPVELVEPMGFDREVLFRLAGKQVKARLDLRSHIQVGDRINLAVEISRILLFNPNSEQRISSLTNHSSETVSRGLGGSLMI